MRLRPPPSLLYGALLAAGCEEPLTLSGDNVDPLDDGALVLLSDALDFGEVSVTKHVTRTLTLDLQNTGTGYLLLEEVSTADPDLFSVVVPVPALGPGEAATLEVTFTPTGDLSAASVLTIQTNDPGAPVLEVPLRGEGLAPRLETSAAALDFGTYTQGCTADLPLTLTNTGRESLTIRSTELLGDVADLGLEEGWLATLPRTLLPGEDATLEVSYRPPDSLSDSALLEIGSDDPEQRSLGIPLAGAGRPAATVQDELSCAQNGKVDVIFAVDVVSTAARLSDIKAHFSSFTARLRQGGMDYQIALVVEDDGSVVGADAAITPSNVGRATSIAATMLSGTPGINADRAFTLFDNALHAESAGYPGAWLRSDADLHLIGISEEPEQSSGMSWSEYVYDVQTTLDARTQTFHAIGGNYPSGCGDAAAYTGMYEASVVTGGLFLSICQDGDAWDTTFELLADALITTAGELYLPLEFGAVPESIVILKDGVPLTDGWSYDAATQTIRFTASPTDCDTVDIRYTEQETCPS